MKGLISDINGKALASTDFRQVLESGAYTQIVIMSIPVGGDIGMEVHPDTDQVLYLLEGSGKVILDGEEAAYHEGDIVLVHAGTNHNFVNTGDKPLKIITTYSPPHHPAGTVHKTKEEAEKASY